MKRALLLIACLLLWAQPAQAAWTVSATRTACGSSCSVTDTFADSVISMTGLSVVIGDFIGVTVHYNNTGVGTISSVVCAGNALSSAQTQSNANAVAAVYFIRATETCDTVVVTLSESPTSGNDLVTAVIATPTADPAAETGTSVGADTAATMTHDTADVTPAASEVLFIGAYTNLGGATMTNDAAYTAIATNLAANTSAYLIQTGTTAQDYTVTSAANESGAIALAAFEGGAAGGTRRRLVFD